MFTYCLKSFLLNEKKLFFLLVNIYRYLARFFLFMNVTVDSSYEIIVKSLIANSKHDRCNFIKYHKVQ